jgi:MinD-like ATPase involved in chromosome partitioning or flagellar assembly
VTSGLLTAGAGHPWETDLVAALDRPGAPYLVVRRCADIADVLAAAATGVAVAAVLSSDLRRLDSEAVRRLEALGVAVVAVHPAGDPRAAARLGRIGIRTTVRDDAGSAAILAAVGSATGRSPADRLAADRGGADRDGAAASHGSPPDRTTVADATAGLGPPSAAVGGAGMSSDGPGPGPIPGAGGGRDADPGGSLRWFSRGRRRSGPRRDPVVSDPASALSGGPDPRWPAGAAAAATVDPARVVGPESADAPHAGSGGGRSGTVIAVWGPTGAPGRSTVAMGIADEAAAAGAVVLLIDADVYGGVLAAAFGLLDESPGLAGACRTASNGRLDGATLTGLCWSLAPGLTVLTGITRADRWPEVRPSAIPMVLEVARGLADVVVVDCAPILETDEEISYDTMAPRRNGATLAVLADADIVLAVGAGDPPGIERLVRGLAELADAVPGASPRVVVNRIRRSAASRREIDDALARFAGLGVSAHLPEDRDATDAAWRRGVGLSLAAPRSGLRQGLAALAGSLIPPLIEGAVTSGAAHAGGPRDGHAGGQRDARTEAAARIGGGWSPGKPGRGRHSGTVD